MLRAVTKGFVTAILLLILAAGVASWFVWQKMNETLPVPAEGVVFELEPGASIRQVATNLQNRKLLANRWLLEIWARWIEPGSAIKSGEYFLESGLTISGLLKKFRDGMPVQHKITIIEGSRFQDAVAQIGKAVEAGLMKQVIPDGKYAEAFKALSGEASPEGWVFPDTYHFPKGQTDKSFLKQAYQRMKRTLEQAWEQRKTDLPLKTPYEALILASIVEKETGVAPERPIIAGVFINRLRKGMRLQTDPTVIYGMGDKYQGNIRKKDLQTDTPFNTYTRKGLPPTPIALPGAEAIQAVLQPETTEALYFVAMGKGRHYFSKTYKEHKHAVIKYLLHGNASRYHGGK